MIRTAFIGIGSNIGNRLENCKKAIEVLVANEQVKLIKTSSFYEAEPWGGIEQGWFINCVVEIETGLDANLLLSLLHNIENRFGRERKEKGGPRIVDMDILFYNNEVISAEGLIVPHPLLHKRRFVLMPLSEIAPYFIHPVFKKPVSDMLREVDDNKIVVRADTL